MKHSIGAWAAGLLCVLGAMCAGCAQAAGVGVWQLRQELFHDLLRTDSIQGWIQGGIISDVHAGPSATVGFGEALRPDLCAPAAEGLWCAPEAQAVEPSPPEELSE